MSHFAYAIHSYRQDKEEQCPPKQFLVRYTPEQREQYSQQGIQHQDVSAPNEHQVQEAEEKQHPHPPVKDAESVRPFPLRIADDDGEADAEQQGKQRIELAVDKDIQQADDDGETYAEQQGKQRIEFAIYKNIQQVTGNRVCHSRRHSCHRFRRKKRVKGKLREVCHTDA